MHQYLFFLEAFVTDWDPVRHLLAFGVTGASASGVTGTSGLEHFFAFGVKGTSGLSCLFVFEVTGTSGLGRPFAFVTTGIWSEPDSSLEISIGESKRAATFHFKQQGTGKGD